MTIETRLSNTLYLKNGPRTVMWQTQLLDASQFFPRTKKKSRSSREYSVLYEVNWKKEESAQRNEPNDFHL